MKLGFVSAILPELSFEELIDYTAELDYKCIEVCCWPVGKAERRYAGVTHIDVDTLDDPKVNHINQYLKHKDVEISALGYYPNPLFDEIKSDHFGLNYDPSHLLWTQMDYVRPLYEFHDKLFHIHLKDAKVYREKLNDVGILATPIEFHSPKLPGLGDIDWGRFISALNDIRYEGPACIEVEDKAFEGSLEERKYSLVLSKRYLGQYL